jgi:hypothetical protein
MTPFDEKKSLVTVPGPPDSAKVSESPKYTKQRFCPARLNHNAKVF